METMVFCLFLVLFSHLGSATATATATATSTSTSFPDEGPSYDHSTNIECKSAPEAPLYNGGLLNNQPLGMRKHKHNHLKISVGSLAFVLNNLTGDTIYSFSSWVKISGAHSASICTNLTSDNASNACVGTVTARSGCWSFLKGGFVLEAPSTNVSIYFLVCCVVQDSCMISLEFR